MERNCFDCKYIHLSLGDSGYSEWTPGYPGTFECEKGVWGFDECDHLTNKKVRETIALAETCEKFVPWKKKA